MPTPASFALGLYGLFGFHVLYFAALRLAPTAEAGLIEPREFLFVERAAAMRAEQGGGADDRTGLVDVHEFQFRQVQAPAGGRQVVVAGQHHHRRHLGQGQQGVDDDRSHALARVVEVDAGSYRGHRRRTGRVCIDEIPNGRVAQGFGEASQRSPG